MMPCLSCQKSSSSPHNFLLNCISCSNSWHHRCHLPPVSDKELISIIKAFNAAKHNPAAKLIWQCGICIITKNAVNQKSRQLIAAKKATARQFAAPQKTIVIIDDDDDEIIALDGPSEVPKHEITNPEVDHLSNTVVPQRSSTSQDTFSHSRHRSSNAASYDHIRPPPGRASGTKDKQIRIINDPFLVPDLTAPPAKLPQTSSSTKLSDCIDLTIPDDEGDGSDDVLEYLTPAPTSKQVVHEELPQTSTSKTHPLRKDASTAQTTTTSQLLNHLLTRWLNDRSTSVGVKPDIWARACLRRDQDAANRSLGSNSAHPPSISPPSRRKYKAYNLSEKPLTDSRATVFLSAEEWLHEKRANLLLE